MDDVLIATAAAVKPEPCLWVRDLDDTTSDSGRKVVAEIRRQCPCNECKQLREKQNASL